MEKMIFVTGGVVSSIGKGITTASLGRLLTNRGYRVHALKIDPYINVDAVLRRFTYLFLPVSASNLQQGERDEKEREASARRLERVMHFG